MLEQKVMDELIEKLTEYTGTKFTPNEVQDFLDENLENEFSSGITEENFAVLLDNVSKKFTGKAWPTSATTLRELQGFIDSFLCGIESR